MPGFSYIRRLLPPHTLLCQEFSQPTFLLRSQEIPFCSKKLTGYKAHKGPEASQSQRVLFPAFSFGPEQSWIYLPQFFPGP